jgi:hypothetical protein
MEASEVFKEELSVGLWLMSSAEVVMVMSSLLEMSLRR